MGRGQWKPGATTACVAAVGALSLMPTAALGAVVTPSKDPFTKPPVGFAKRAPGTVLRSRTISVDAQSGGVAGTLGAAAGFQLLYRTTDEHGKAIVTLTTILLPAEPAPGARRLLSFQNAEDSLTTGCAPSYLLRQPKASGAIAIEKANIAAGLAQGWVVAIPDHEGPRSELLVGPLGGRLTLDGVRAVESFAKAGLPGRSTAVGLSGYSGGSVPTGWAAALAPTYAPELKLAGVAIGGIAADPRYILSRIDGTPLFGGALLSLVAIDRAYPELQLDAVLNSTGRTTAASFGRDEKGCIIGVASLPNASMSQFTTFPSSAAMAAAPPFKAVLAKLNLLTAPVPGTPMYLLNSTKDEIMFVERVDALSAKYCKAKATVTYDRPTTGGHLAASVTFRSSSIAYLAERFAGRPVQSTCSTGPRDPGATTG